MVGCPTGETVRSQLAIEDVHAVLVPVQEALLPLRRSVDTCALRKRAVEPEQPASSFDWSPPVVAGVVGWLPVLGSAIFGLVKRCLRPTRAGDFTTIRDDGESSDDEICSARRRARELAL